MESQPERLQSVRIASALVGIPYVSTKRLLYPTGRLSAAPNTQKKNGAGWNPSADRKSHFPPRRASPCRIEGFPDLRTRKLVGLHAVAKLHDRNPEDGV